MKQNQGKPQHRKGGKKPEAGAATGTAPAKAAAPDRYIVTPQPTWHGIKFEDQPGHLVHRSRGAADARRDVNSLLLRGMDLLKDEGKRFSSDKTRTGGDSGFMRTVLKGGTMTDRISALTLLVQSSPVHNLLALEQLFNMARKKNRRMIVMVIDALKDLLTGGGLSAGTGSDGLLPSDRRLRFFIDSVTGVDNPSDAQLVLFAFEDRLKRLVFEFLGALEQLSHDPLVYIRSRTASVFLDMLASKPEQEQNLLKLLVNKLGDQERKLAAKASHLLHQLTTEHHPAMKLVVAKALEEFMMRPHVGARAHYCAVITLNQMMLSKDEVDVAQYLIEVYFAFFNKLAKDAQDAKSPIDHKILSGLLTGVNRAFPYAKDALAAAGDATLDKHLNTLFKITHYDAFTVRVQALSLIFQVMQASKPDVAGRFYRSLYATLLDARGVVATKQLSLYLNLVYRAVKADPSTDRVQAFVKRILQLAANDRHVGFVIGCLWIVSHIMQSRPVLWNMVKLAEEESPASGKHYDPFHRTPEFAHAGAAGMWELVPLVFHYHPSVQVFAQSLLEGKPITLPAGVDPLDTYTLAKFLDKFTYKKPKKNAKAGPSNSLAAALNRSSRAGFIPAGEDDATSTADNAPKPAAVIKVGHGLPVNSDKFLAKPASEIAVDEVFFHRFFTKQSELRPKKKAAKGKKSLDADFDNVIDDDKVDYSALDAAAAQGGEESEYSDVEEDKDIFGEDEIEQAIMNSAGFSKSHLSGADGDSDTDDDELAALEAGMREGESDDDDEAGFVDVDEDDDEDIDLEAAFADAAGGADSDDDGEGADNAADFDDEDDGFDSDDDAQSRRKKEKAAKGKTKLGYSLSGSVFASADEFSRMLESNEGLESDDDFGELVAAKDVGKRSAKKRKAPSGRGGGGGGRGGGNKRRRKH
ncbi:RNA-binding ribosome biosynthesis protein mak21 [Blastocladiella emersonii ATCC 22665]|nr:RNA-binding ribosome biosynthesis protein mak21 [Blastocladiella emersonii ATCC 22665]